MIINILTQHHSIMDKKRREALNKDTSTKLTQIEKDEGFHFCPDWDFMLVGPLDESKERCTCNN